MPEIDSHLKLNPSVRLYLEAKDDRDGSDPPQFTFGPSIQPYRKALIKLKHVTAFDLDDSKSRALVLEAGYRYITAPGLLPENRAPVAVTPNFPMKADFQISDRNRADLDWRHCRFTWRYRNKFTIERAISIRSYHLIPYVAVEPYYESRYSNGAQPVVHPARTGQRS